MGIADPADSFIEQVLPYARQLHSVALRPTGNSADAEDLVQETYAKTYAGFGTFKPGTNLRAWLHRVEANAFTTPTGPAAVGRRCCSSPWSWCWPGT